MKAKTDLFPKLCVAFMWLVAILGAISVITDDGRWLGIPVIAMCIVIGLLAMVQATIEAFRGNS